MILSIDPGESTGVAFGEYSDTDGYELVDCTQIQGGANGFLQWAVDNHFYDLHPELVVVSEKFVLRSSNQFVANVEPVRIEGVMLALWGSDRVVYQQRSDKTLVDDRVLKRHGLWQTGKEHGWVDGRDVNDAIIHGLAFLKKAHHRPTLRKYWGSEDFCGND